MYRRSIMELLYDNKGFVATSDRKFSATSRNYLDLSSHAGKRLNKEEIR